MQIPGLRTLNSEKRLARFDSAFSKLTLAISVIAAGYILGFLVIACVRLFFPFDLEWIEGAYVDEARWIFQGNFPYGPPSIFISFRTCFTKPGP